MTESRFRKILWLYVALTAAALLASGFPPHSDALQAAVDQDSTSWIWDHLWVSGGAFAVLVIAWLAGIVGLFRFKAWGRPLSVYATVGTVLVSPFMDSTLYWGVERGLYEASSMLWGIVLALAYFSPVSARFGRQ